MFSKFSNPDDCASREVFTLLNALFSCSTPCSSLMNSSFLGGPVLGRSNKRS